MELDKQALDRWLTTEPEQEPLDLSELMDNGDRMELPDGRAFVLHVEADESTSINDYECYGRIEWTRDGDYGPVRPSDFTGRARILDRDHYNTLWWEPYWEKGLTPEQIAKEEFHIQELIRYGFCQVGLELLEKCDKCDHWHSVDTEWIGGVDSLEGGHLAELLDDLAAELLA